MIEQRVTLRYGAQQIPAIVQAVQGDTGRDVIFELADYEIPAGATANYYIDKPDDTAIYNSAEVISSTEILAHLTEQALAEPGRNNGQVRILSEGEVITSFDFVLEVEVFRGLMRMQSETEVNIFDEALQAAADDAIQEILDQTPVVTGMQNSIAPTYSSSSTYEVGDYVMYNARLYKCKIAIPTPEAWTAAHWVTVPIASDVNGLWKAVYPYNTLDFVGVGHPKKTTHNGITYTIDGRKIRAQGTLTAGSTSSHLEIYNGPLPIGMNVGETYYAKYEETSDRLAFSIYFYSGSTRLAAYWLHNDFAITVPAGTDTLLLWLLTGDDHEPMDITVEPEFLSNYPNANQSALMTRDITPYIKTDSSGQYVDFNDVTSCGLYIMETSLRKLNAPPGAINALEVYSLNNNNGFLKQVSYSVTRTTSQDFDKYIYTRIKNNAGWSPEWTNKASRFDEIVQGKSLKSYNVYDLLYEYLYYSSYASHETTDKGITFITSEDGSVEVTGTFTSDGFVSHEYYRGALPDGFIPGSELDVKMDSSSGDLYLRLYFYDSDWSSSTRVPYFCAENTSIQVPSYAANLIIWVGTEKTAGTVMNETIHPKILTKPVVEQVNNYNSFNYTVHRDTYNVTATPEIQSTTDLYLAATGTTADRTADIMTLLQTQKVCKLGVGDFYIRTGIDMPDGTSIIGCGRGTRIILDTSVTEGYAISVGTYCSVQDLIVDGLPTGGLPYEEYTPGGRDGIVLLGDATGFDGGSTFTHNFAKLSNLWVRNFNGSGIRAYRNDGAASFLATNIDILSCGIGINIEMFSEFHAWNNIRCRWCVYACIMNGGNNLFSNCHWDVCIHLLKIDNSLGNLVNDTHSSFTNCTFCHANNNQGIAIEMINVANGVVFSNCQVFYSKIVLTDTKGVVINGFNFGNSEQIILTRCKGINICNCIFGTAPVITKDDVTGFIWSNNMTRNGVIIPE